MPQRGAPLAAGGPAEDPRWTTESATAAEITAATADVRCQHESRFVDLWVAVTAEEQLVLLEEKAELLKQAKPAMKTRLRNATAVLGSDPPS